MNRQRKQAALPTDLKSINRQKILSVIRRGEAFTVAQVHAQTGISRPTVVKAVQTYLDQGVVRSLGPGSAAALGGKKPEVFTFADERKILCINLWPDTLSLSLCGLVGPVEHVQQYPCTAYGDLQAVFALLRERVSEYLTDLDVAPEMLYGVALSVPGTVDHDMQRLRYNSQAPAWGENIPLAERLAALFPAHTLCTVENAGKAAGRAVLYENTAFAQARLLTLFTTWGVSACLSERGHVLNGRDSLIGEIGHMVISDDASAVCGCGKHGCLEQLVSLAQIKQRLETAGITQPLTVPALFALSQAGNESARVEVRRLAHCFAVALHNLSLTYDQDVVVFQGDFAWADETFDTSLKQELAQFRYYPGCVPFTISYDRRDLALLAAAGGAELLRKKYFAALETI